MPRVFKASDGGLIIHLTAQEIGHEKSSFDMAWSKVFYGSSGTQNLPSRNKPLAPGKPVKRSAKGKPAKAGVKARKGT